MAADISYIGATEDTVDRTTYTFAGHSIGTTNATRKTIVVIAARSAGTTRTLDSVSVGGVAATAINNIRKSTTNTQHAAIFLVNSGDGTSLSAATTADIVVTFSAAAARCVIGVYRITGSSAAAFHLDSGTADNADPPGSGLDIPPGGSAVSAAGTGGATAGVTWDNLTEDRDAVSETAMPHSWASADFASAQTALNVAPDFLAPVFETAFAAASFADALPSAAAAAAGTGAASGVGSSTAASAASATGSGAATAVGTGILPSAAAASGDGAAAGVGTGINFAVGSAAGVGAALAVAVPEPEVAGRWAAYSVAGAVAAYSVEGQPSLP